MLAAFWGVSALLALTPGADWAYAISSAVRPGGALPAVAGMLTGHLAATFAVAAGVASLIAASDTAMSALTLIGALYLLWLGATSLLRSPAQDTSEPAAPAGRARTFAKGAGVSMLNPKLLLLFLALLPQFTDPGGAWAMGAQMVALGLVHVFTCAVIYSGVAFGVGAVLTERPRAARAVGLLSGLVMIALGLALAGEQLLAYVR
ncbi:LysE family translocator [Nocardiopsis coralli]|uniref:LysE family translocator n=1 Tax=Nocardiopsis coralli TaxID=2772213 RepID=UPI001F2CF25A|nr:LysE family translocator [Nocardiopsis coralli]